MRKICKKIKAQTYKSGSLNKLLN